MGESFQDWMRAAIEKAGGQSELARELRRRFPRLRVTPQAIQHLAVPKKGKKPAQSSRLTPYIAAVTGLPVYGITQVDKSSAAPYLSTPRDGRILEQAQEIEGVEFTKDALQVAKAFMDLPRNLRDEFKRKIETAALEYTSVVADETLHHLAAPGPKPDLTPLKKRRRFTSTQ